MTTRVNPTFLLKGINPNELLNDYQNGQFSVIKPSPGGKIVIAKNMIVVAPKYSDSNHEHIFSFKDKNNIDMIYATGNHTNYEIYLAGGEELPVGGRCDWCKEDFTHESLGYPIGYQEQTILVDDHHRVIYVFWVEGEFCCFECAFADLKRSNNQTPTYRDINIRDSETMLKMLFVIMFPNESVLQPAKDYRLLKFNKGSLDKEEWKNTKHKYFRTERVLMVPAKIEYLRYS